MRFSLAIFLAVPTQGFQPVFRTQPQVPTRLFLADEIKDYKKGLSKINGTGSGEQVSNKMRIFPRFLDEILTVWFDPKSRTDCVFKFGGSSLANDERIDHVANLIKDQIEHGFQPRAVVCSAMGKTTNNLLSAGEFALGKQSTCEVTTWLLLLFWY